MALDDKEPKLHRSLTVDFLIIVFGISSWVAVNGLWVELPVLVNSLPESWQLASYIIITTQLANIGPIIFGAARKIWSQKVLEVPIIHASLVIVIAACACMIFFWDHTSYIFNHLHSTSLLVLTFFLAFVDCTSSLLYLPFIGNFKEQYVISYLVGSGLSGPIPGLLALAQGVGGYASCRNVSTVNAENETTYVIEAYHPPPRFSVSIFFAVLCVEMIISWIAFVLLTKLPVAHRERVTRRMSRNSHPALQENFQSSVEKDLSSSIEKSGQSLLGNSLLTKTQYIVVLLIQGYVSTMHNGVLLSIQTYSCLPYGNVPYHLAVTLSSIANPLCCFMAMFLPVSSVTALLGITAFCSAWAGYILATALLSPTPPLVHSALGSFLVVLSWVMVSGVVAFIKACVASILRRAGGQPALYRCGVVTQIGSAIGAVTTFLTIQYTTLFNSYSPCG